MKKDLQRLEIIEKTIIEVEISLNLIESDLIVIDNDLDYLKKLEEDLIYNISLLRKEKVIAIASQYRRSTDELKVIRRNIKNYECVQKNIASKMIKMLDIHKREKEKRDSIKKELSNEKVILLFDPKRKKKNK